MARARERFEGDKGGLELVQPDADRDRHPGVVIAVRDESGDLEPRRLVEVTHRGPVDAEAGAGDPLGGPYQRSRETSDDRNKVPVDLVVDGRVQVKHGRVKHHARYLL